MTQNDFLFDVLNCLWLLSGSSGLSSLLLNSVPLLLWVELPDLVLVDHVFEIVFGGQEFPSSMKISQVTDQALLRSIGSPSSTDLTGVFSVFVLKLILWMASLSHLLGVLPQQSHGAPLGSTVFAFYWLASWSAEFTEII